MTRILLTIIALQGTIFCLGQNSVDQVLAQIERNNPELKAVAAEVEAERLAGKAETLLANPEIEFNYLWGAENIGGRRDLRVSQAFDIPTITGMKAGMAEGMGELASLKYKTERQAVLLEAKQACIDLVYCNAILAELRTHLTQSTSLVSSYEKRMKAGESTVLDLNKARIHLTTVQGKANRVEVERQSLLSKLRSLNGGKEIDFDAFTYGLEDTIPDDFETWFDEASQDSPILAYVRKQAELENRQLAIDKASRLPEFAVGYMSEIRTQEKFRGVTVGVNIPLWSAGNKIRQSQARLNAAKERQNAAEQKFLSDLRNQYTKAYSMKENSEMMRSSLKEADSREFLFSALSKGEISIIDYLVEIDLYFEALEATMEAERDYRHALASLTAYSL